MNERIKEIARQATKDVETRPDTGICSMEKYNARFAELIVRECSQYLWANEAEWTANKEDRMLQHFGIKE